MPCRLIPLNKNPSVQPIGMCEVIRRIVGKAVMAFSRLMSCKQQGLYKYVLDTKQEPKWQFTPCALSLKMTTPVSFYSWTQLLLSIS